MLGQLSMAAFYGLGVIGLVLLFAPDEVFERCPGLERLLRVLAGAALMVIGLMLLSEHPWVQDVLARFGKW